TWFARAAILFMSAAAAACGDGPPPASPKAAVPIPHLAPTGEEAHLADLKQLTLGGENAEAYWAGSGRELILQSRTGDADCDRIYRMPLDSVLGARAGAGTLPTPVAVSSGRGATTCSYFMPGD